jgi:hypothetical protein
MRGTRPHAQGPVRPHVNLCYGVCVYYAGPSTKLFTGGGGEYGRTCATRDDEPSAFSHVFQNVCECVCLLLQDLVRIYSLPQ